MADSTDKIDLFPLDEFNVRPSQPPKKLSTPPRVASYTPPPPTITTTTTYKVSPPSASKKANSWASWIIIVALIWGCMKCGHDDDDKSTYSSRQESFDTADIVAPEAAATAEAMPLPVDSSKLYSFDEEKKKPKGLSTAQITRYQLTNFNPAKKYGNTPAEFYNFKMSVSSYYAIRTLAPSPYRFACASIMGNVLLLRVLDTAGIKRYFLPPNFTFITNGNNTLKFTETRTPIRLVTPKLGFEDLSNWSQQDFENKTVLVQDWNGGDVYKVNPMYIRYYEEIPVLCMPDKFESYLNNTLNVIYIPKRYLEQVINHQEIDDIDISDVPSFNLRGEEDYY